MDIPAFITIPTPSSTRPLKELGREPSTRWCAESPGNNDNAPQTPSRTSKSFVERRRRDPSTPLRRARTSPTMPSNDDLDKELGSSDHPRTAPQCPVRRTSTKQAPRCPSRRSSIMEHQKQLFSTAA